MPNKILQVVRREIPIQDILEEIKAPRDPPDLERKAIEDFMFEIAEVIDFLRGYYFPLLQRHRVLQLEERLEIQESIREVKEIISRIAGKDRPLISILATRIELLNNEVRKK